MNFFSTNNSSQVHVKNALVSQVSFSGFFLTSLVQQAASNFEDEDIEGLLCGIQIDQLKSVTTDFEERQEKVETEISLQSYIPTSKRGIFYDSKGSVDFNKVKEIFDEGWQKKEGEQELVGWFVVRKNSGDMPSLRDAAVHKCLSRQAGESKPCLFLLINIELLQGNNTQGLTYKVLQHSSSVPRTSRFEPIPMVVRNASGNAHAEYSSFAPAGALSALSTPGLSAMVEAMNSLYNVCPPVHVQEQETMFDAILESIDVLVQEVKMKEKEVCQLREELKYLEQELL